MPPHLALLPRLSQPLGALQGAEQEGRGTLRIRHTPITPPGRGKLPAHTQAEVMLAWRKPAFLEAALVVSGLRKWSLS